MVSWSLNPGPPGFAVHVPAALPMRCGVTCRGLLATPDIPDRPELEGGWLGTKWMRRSDSSVPSSPDGQACAMLPGSLEHPGGPWSCERCPREARIRRSSQVLTAPPSCRCCSGVSWEPGESHLLPSACLSVSLKMHSSGSIFFFF